MQDELTPTPSDLDTQHGMEWSPEEIARLDQFAPSTTRKGELLKSFPGRSLPAIRMRLAHRRRALGIKTVSYKVDQDAYDDRCGPAMLDPKDPGFRGIDWQDTQRQKNVKADREFLSRLAALAI